MFCISATTATGRMHFRQPELTTGSRPSLQDDETLSVVQDAVGLYEGKYKIADRQNGHAYLTSHRIYYVDDAEPRKLSLYVELKDIERYEYQAGFLRSSAKITIFPKPVRRGAGSKRNSLPPHPHLQRLQQSASSPGSRTSSPFRPIQSTVASAPAVNASWVCPVCSFTNPVPSNFDPAVAAASSIPPCLMCGVKPPIELVLKSVIAAGSSKPVEPLRSVTTQTPDRSSARRSSFSSGQDTLTCPRCTYHNHPALRTCEVCGASLPAPESSRDSPPVKGQGVSERSGSPAPEIAHLSIDTHDEPASMKLSFRQGGDKAFYEKLKHAMIQRKWLATHAPPIPRPLDNILTDSVPSRGSTPSPAPGATRPGPGKVGIAGLEQRGMHSRKINEAVLGTAFEDLEALMASAKEVVALAQKFRLESANGQSDASLDSILSESAGAIGMVATKDMLNNKNEAVYISQLARDLAEYVTDERQGRVRMQGGTVSLVDVWAQFNRKRDGVELVSPADFQKATGMWGTLGLPVQLKKFKSGLLAVQLREFSDDRVIEMLRKWISDIKAHPPESTLWDWQRYSRGVTVQDAAQKYGWSLGVAVEELEMAEERGLLCREDSSEGLKFWLNLFDGDSDDEDMS